MFLINRNGGSIGFDDVRPTSSIIRPKTGSVIVPRPSFGANKNKYVTTEPSSVLDTKSYFPSYYPYGGINFNDQYQVQIHYTTFQSHFQTFKNIYLLSNISTFPSSLICYCNKEA